MKVFVLVFFFAAVLFLRVEVLVESELVLAPRSSPERLTPSPPPPVVEHEERVTFDPQNPALDTHAKHAYQQQQQQQHHHINGLRVHNDDSGQDTYYSPEHQRAVHAALSDPYRRQTRHQGGRGHAAAAGDDDTHVRPLYQRSNTSRACEERLDAHEFAGEAKSAWAWAAMRLAAWKESSTSAAHKASMCPHSLLRALAVEYLRMTGACDDMVESIEPIPVPEAFVNVDVCTRLQSNEVLPTTEARVVYFIMVYHAVPQFERMLKVMHAPGNVYLVQVDEHADPSFVQWMTQAVMPYPNVCLMRYGNVVRFSAEIVGTALRAMQFAVENLHSWTHFITLSGQDYPLVSQDVLAHYLTRPAHRNHSLVEPPGKDIENVDRERLFVHICDAKSKDRYVVLPREPWVFNISLPIPRTLHRGRSLQLPAWHDPEVSTDAVLGYPVADADMRARQHLGLRWAKKGGFFNVLHRDFVRFLVSDPRSLKLWGFFRNTYIADEHFIPTVYWNTPYFHNSTTPAHNLCFMLWSNPRSSHNDVLRTGMLPRIQGHGYLFARRFDVHVDNNILDAIDAHVPEFNEYVLRKKDKR